jgi:glutamate dehydrogenase (NAD(P)+)
VEGVITAKSALGVSGSVRVLAEAANGPTTRDGDQVLAQRDIFVIPDILCNSGGVICSYFEGVQNEANYYWSLPEVEKRLEQRMSVAFDSVLDMAKRSRASMRNAAYMIAIERVVRAMHSRGWV